MGNVNRGTFFIILGVFLIVSGCSKPVPKTTYSVKEAIRVSKQKPNEEAQIHYLVEQAHTFIDRKKYKNASAVCKYIITEFGEDSEELKEVVQRLKEEVTKYALEMVERGKRIAGGSLEQFEGKLPE